MPICCAKAAKHLLTYSCRQARLLGATGMQSAGDQLEEVMGKRTRAIERKLRQVEQLPHEESQKILPIDVEDDLTDY